MSNQSNSLLHEGQELWYLGESGQAKGPFPAVEIIDGLNRGITAPSMYACRAGQHEWRMLSAWPEFAPTCSAITPPPPPDCKELPTSSIGAPTVQQHSSASVDQTEHIPLPSSFNTIGLHQPVAEEESGNLDLFWRRVSAFSTDLLFLHLLIFVFYTFSGSRFLAITSAWVTFFGIWFWLHLKYNVSPGKWLVRIRATTIIFDGKKGPALITHFALAWLPLLVIALPAYDPALLSFQGLRAFIQIMEAICWMWYPGVLISLIVTRGQRGLHDFISKSITGFEAPSALSASRKALASVLAIALISEMILVASFGSAEPTLPSSQSDSAKPTYSREMNYEPDQISSFYQGRIFEVETTWQQPGGLLWLNSVTNEQSGTALMFVNNSSSGLLITNWHVAAPSPTITGGYHCRVRRSPQEGFIDGEIVAKGKNGLDLAIIRVNLVGQWTPWIVPTSRINDLHQGERAIAIGNALAQGISVTDGLISMVEGDVGMQQIRTSAPISPGNSGGPLVLQRGALFAGIMTAQNIADRAENVNYAVPAEYLWNTDNWEFFIDDPSPVEAMLRGDVK